MLRILSLFLVLAACSSQEPIELHGRTMGTTWTVTLDGPLSDARTRRAEAIVYGVLADVDAALSSWNPASQLSAFNASDGTAWIAMSEALYTVLDAGAAVQRSTGGAFDVTIAPLVALWGFGAGAGSRGNPSARTLVGPGMLELRAEPRAARKRVPGVRLDVDAIAPGYAVDRISEALLALGYENHIVEIGGEIRCRGLGPGGRPWRIGIERPQPGASTVQAGVALLDLGISTSGDYRDFRVLDGTRIAHTIDPRSGRPVTHGLASVSVVHESAMLADAYATALMVLGPDAGYALAERLELPAFFIARSGDGFVTRATQSFARLQSGDPDLQRGAHK
jgi:thiamine biosynthesis lipoprotein